MKKLRPIVTNRRNVHKQAKHKQRTQTWFAVFKENNKQKGARTNFHLAVIVRKKAEDETI